MKALVSFLSFLGRGAAKLIAWLLFKLGLWVPAVFSLLFVLVVLVTGTSFKDVLSIYLFCLIATVIFAIAVNVLLFFRRIDKRAAEKKRATAFISDTKPSEDKKVAFVEGANDTDVRIQPAEPTQKSDFTGGKPEDKPLFPTDNVNPDLNRPAANGGYYTSNTANGAGGNNYYNPNTDNRPAANGGYYTPNTANGAGGDNYYNPNTDNRSAANGGYYTSNTANGAVGNNYYNSNTDNRSAANGGYYTPNTANGAGGDNYYNPNTDNRPAANGGYYSSNTANGAGGDRYYPSDTDNRNTDKGRYYTAEVKDGGDAASTNGFLPYNVPLRHEEDERRFSDESRGDSLYGNNSFRIHAEEKPMIFRTRMDSTLLIYEYSDRLEFYRKTLDGPVKLSVEYKNKY